MDNTQSLLDTAPPLPGLTINQSKVGTVPREIAPGEYSAVRFFAQHPDAYREIARGIAEGVSDAELSREYCCHHRTVAAIRAREAAGLEAGEYRKVLGGRLRGANALLVGEIISRLSDPNELRDIPFKDLIAGSDKLSNQERLLAGEPNQIVGHLQSSGADEYLRELVGSPSSIHSQAKKKAGGTLAPAPGRAREGDSIAVLQEGQKACCRDDVSRDYDMQTIDTQCVRGLDTVKDTNVTEQSAGFGGDGGEDRLQGVAGSGAG